MATTRGQDEPTPTREERVVDALSQAIAGQGVLRRVVLYTLMFACMGLAYYVSVLVVPALVCGVLLLATDKGVG